MVRKYTIFSGKTVVRFLLLSVLVIPVSGCVLSKYDKGDEGVTFTKIGGFTEPNGQAKIRLITYTGQAEMENVKTYAEQLGCGMMFAYFYPETSDRSLIPVEEIQAARSIVEAREILFKGEGVGKWRFATQCLSLIPTVTDCLKSPISTNCR
jgi:hypothetical protein